MGLDMYLDGIEVLGDGKIERTDCLVEWRKANAIHGWFDKNIHKIRNLEHYKVTRNDLQKLYDTCKAVLDDPNKAEELLPHMEGCFFGKYDYGDWYWDDLKYTEEEVRELLADETYDYFEYRAWW